MVYVAAGISGLTGIAGTFFVKEYLGLTAEFLAVLGFWARLHSTFLPSPRITNVLTCLKLKKFVSSALRIKTETPSSAQLVQETLLPRTLPPYRRRSAIPH